MLHLANSLPHPCNVWPRMGKQLLTVIRHGKRLDEVEAFWRVTAERPWDPPLWPEGLIAVRMGAPFPMGVYACDRSSPAPVGALQVDGK